MGPAVGSDEPSEIIYGLHAVREALRSGSRPIRKLLVARLDRQFADLVRMAKSVRVPVHVAPGAALDRLVPTGNHQGAIGLIAPKAYTDPEEILQYASAREEPPFLVVLDGVEDPRNLGAVLRAAEAAGVHGVFVPERRAAGLTGTVAKAAAGALEHLRVAQVPNINSLIEYLQQRGVWVYALDPEATKPYTDLDLRRAIALVFGSEGKGIRRNVLAKCDDQASIPMHGHVASLNVSAAAAILFFETVRQRTAGAR